MALYDLIVQVSANTADLVEGMKRAEESVNTFVEAAKKVGEALAIREIALFTREMTEAGDAMQTAIEVSGASSEGFQQLAFAANVLGVSTQTVTGAMEKMQLSLGQAQQAGGKQSEALRALGLSYAELKALKPEDQFLLILSRTRDLTSATDQALASRALFNRSFQDLLPLIKANADELDRLRHAAPIVSEDDQQRLTEANHAITEMELQLKALAETLVGKVAPAISHFAQDMEELTKGQVSLWQLIKEAGAQAGVLPSGWALPKGAVEVGAPFGESAPMQRPPGYGAIPDLNKLLPGIRSNLLKLQPTEGAFEPGKIVEQQLQLVAGIDKETAASNQLFERQQAIYDLMKEFPSQQEHWNTLLREAKEDFDHIYDAVQPITVSLRHMPEVLSESQVALRVIVDDFEQAAFAATQAGGSFGRNFAEALIKALESSAIQNAIKRLGDEMTSALSESAKSSSGLFGGALGTILQSVFGLGGAPGVPAAGEYSGAALEGAFQEAGLNDIPAVLASSKRQGGAVFNTSYHIDARGADADRIMSVMPGLLNQSAEKAKRDILDAFNRGGYPAPRRA